MERRPFDNEYVNQLADEIDDSENETVYTVVLQGLDENDLPTTDEESFSSSTNDYDYALKLFDSIKAAGAPCPANPKTKYFAIRLDVQSGDDTWTNKIENLWLE